MHEILSPSNESMDTTKTWDGDFVTQKLNITITNRPDAILDIQDTVGLALRHNPKRAHLLVSKLLGKHIPASPSLIIKAGETLGFMAGKALEGHTADAESLLRSIKTAMDNGNRLPWNHDDNASMVPPANKVDAVCIGYAETATSLGYIVANYLNIPYIHSTRYAQGREAYGQFEEAHSHATSHQLVPEDPGFLNNNVPLVLVDDEISTGHTVIATIKELHAMSPRSHYVVCSLIDCRTDADITAMEEFATSLNTKIDMIALAHGEVKLPATILEDAPAVVATLPQASSFASPYRYGRYANITVYNVDMSSFNHARYGVTTFDENNATLKTMASRLPELKGKTLVLGLEEFMYLPLQLAALLEETTGAEIYSSSTTRSPVLVHNSEDYAVRSNYTFLIDDEKRFVYNAGGFASIVIIVEPGQDYHTMLHNRGLVDLLSNITQNIYILQGENIHE